MIFDISVAHGGRQDITTPPYSCLIIYAGLPNFTVVRHHGFNSSLVVISMLICGRLSEAEAAITAGRVAHKHRNMLDEIVTEFGDMASFALRLLANVYW